MVEHGAEAEDEGLVVGCFVRGLGGGDGPVVRVVVEGGLGDVGVVLGAEDEDGADVYGGAGWD